MMFLVVSTPENIHRNKTLSRARLNVYSWNASAALRIDRNVSLYYLNSALNDGKGDRFFIGCAKLLCLSHVSPYEYQIVILASGCASIYVRSASQAVVMRFGSK